MLDKLLFIRLFLTVLVIGFSAMPIGVLAQQPDLYTVAVPIDATDPEGREIADREALRRVLIRVTGSADEMQLGALAEIFDNPRDYVSRFRTVANDEIEVSFNGAAIERLLRQARYTVWSGDRPLTLVWLAVDWGQGEREIVAADGGIRRPGVARTIDRNRLLRERVEKVAAFRGVPVVFPLLDTEDLGNIRFTDIWGQFDEQLLAASQRYGANSILVGRIRPGAQQRNRWTYYFGDEKLTWTGEPEEVVQRLADKLAVQFAVPGDAELQTYGLAVAGIDSVVAYGQVQQLVANLSVIEEVRLRRVTGQEMLYSVRVYGGIDRLSKALELSPLLQPAEITVGGDPGQVVVPDPNLLRFEYQP